LCSHTSAPHPLMASPGDGRDRPEGVGAHGAVGIGCPNRGGTDIAQGCNLAVAGEVPITRPGCRSSKSSAVVDRRRPGYRRLREPGSNPWRELRRLGPATGLRPDRGLPADLDRPDNETAEITRPGLPVQRCGGLPPYQWSPESTQLRPEPDGLDIGQNGTLTLGRKPAIFRGDGPRTVWALRIEGPCDRKSGCRPVEPDRRVWSVFPVEREHYTPFERSSKQTSAPTS